MSHSGVGVDMGQEQSRKCQDYLGSLNHLEELMQGNEPPKVIETQCVTRNL